MNLEAEIVQAEKTMKKDIEEMGEEFIVNEAKVLSAEIVGIILKDILASDSGMVTYSSNEGNYEVSFAFSEIKMPDGKLGVFEEIPDDNLMRQAETVAFLIGGMHGKKEVEADFHGDTLEVAPSVEIRRIHDFQLSVLKSVRK